MLKFREQSSFDDEKSKQLGQHRHFFMKHWMIYDKKEKRRNDNIGKNVQISKYKWGIVVYLVGCFVWVKFSKVQSFEHWQISHFTGWQIFGFNIHTEHEKMAWNVSD